MKFIVPDLSCAHCVHAVTAALQALDPQARVAVDLLQKTVEVAGHMDATQAEQALTAAGYPPRSVAPT